MRRGMERGRGRSCDALAVLAIILIHPRSVSLAFSFLSLPFFLSLLHPACRVLADEETSTRGSSTQRSVYICEETAINLVLTPYKRPHIAIIIASEPSSAFTSPTYPSRPLPTCANATGVSPMSLRARSSTTEFSSVWYHVSACATFLTDKAFGAYCDGSFIARSRPTTLCLSVSATRRYAPASHHKPASAKNGFISSGLTSLLKWPIITHVPPSRTYCKTACQTWALSPILVNASSVIIVAEGRGCSNNRRRAGWGFFVRWSFAFDPSLSRRRLYSLSKYG